MNLLVGCKVKSKKDNWPEGIIVFVQSIETANSWSKLKVWFMDKSGYVWNERINNIEIFDEDIKRINKIGNSPEMKDRILVENCSRFDLMDLRK